MGTGIVVFDYIISIVFYVWFVILFYLSIKRCFWKDDKSRVKLFLLSFFTSPYLSYVEGAGFVTVLIEFLFPNFFADIMNRGSYTTGELILFSSVIAMVYLMLILLYAWLIGKWLGTETKALVIFLYLMFNTIFVIPYKSPGTGMMFSVPYMREIVDIIGTVILYLAVWLFYRLDVRALSEMAQVRIKVNWNIFIIPPAVFTSLYTVFMTMPTTGNDMIEDELMLVIYIFSSIIAFLFIWAFYVIIKNINATDEAVKAKDEVKMLSVEVMEALAHTIDAKDEYTRGHSVRVAKYSRMLAEKLGLTSGECENVYYMGLLHDIGKIGVPNAIINSTTRLTDEQYAIIKTHPGLGYDILAEIKSRPDLSIGARWHHERYDGKGYPDGKSGTDIPLFARIIAVADSYDAMTSNRSYRSFLPQDTVRSEIEKNIGTQFDPEVARCMLTIMDEDVDYVLHE